MEIERGRAYAIAVSTLFLAMLIAPMAATLTGWKGRTLSEHRALSNRPVFPRTWAAAQALPGEIEQYIGDRFPFRGDLVDLHARGLMALGDSPVTDVVFGRDHWLFYRSGMDVYFGHPKISSEQVYWFERMIRERARWLAKRGCKYLFVIVPDKHTVYPEHLPMWMQQFETAPSPREQLLSKVAPDVMALCLDLTDVMQKNKLRGDLYHRTDTHWTSLGAWQGQQAIVERLQRDFPAMTPLPLQAADQRRKIGRGDLATMLPQSDTFTEEMMDGSILVPRAVVESEAGTLTRSRVDDSSLPRAVIFGDSFSYILQPLLREHFSTAAYDVYTGPKTIETEFQTALIYEVNPQIVISEVVERQLVWMHIQQNPPEVIDPEYPPFAAPERVTKP